MNFSSVLQWNHDSSKVQHHARPPAPVPQAFAVKAEIALIIIFEKVLQMPEYRSSDVNLFQKSL
jgi:hypothetical protein